MIRDEFNKTEITNDKQLKRVEFGKTQKSEFTPKKENTIPESDLNEKYVGKTIKKVTEINVDYINKVPTHATQTVVTSATAATGAGVAVASTMVVASTVAVVAIATATGLSIVLHDYHCELTSLFITSNEISCSFLIIDNEIDGDIEYQSYEEEPRKDDRQLKVGGKTAGDPDEEHFIEEDNPESIFDADRPFVLVLSNDNYESEHYLKYGNSEVNTFSDLTLGDTYSIVLKENRYGGQVLYENSFTTGPNSSFLDFYISGEADFRMGTFGVYLDFIDELECLSDFEITFIDKEDADKTYTIPLENVPGYQTASVRSSDQPIADFDFTKEYKYTFSYKNNGDVTLFTSGEISFYNTSSYISEVTGVTWDHKANFLTNEMTLTLNYQDEYNIFSNFKFVLMPEEQLSDGSNEPLVYDLVKTTEPQTINLYENEEFNYMSTYSYMFTYMEEGKDVEQVIESDSGLHFEDNSGTEVTGVTWDKTINLLTKQFSLTLDYTDLDDEEYQRFSDFQLTLKDEEMPEEMYDEPYDLEKTTEEQLVTISSDSNLRLRRPLLYSFSYFDVLDDSRHVIEEGTVTFTDISNGQKQFNGVTINKTPDMDNNTIEVQLDYIDQFEEYFEFRLNLYVDEETPISLLLDSTTEKQTVDVSNYDIDFTKTYHYFVTYYDDEIWEEVSPEEGKGTITFDHSVFNELIFDKTGNFDTMAFDVQLDYVDDFNVFSAFELTLKDDYENEKTFTLVKTTEVQTLYLDDKVQEEFDGEVYEYNKFNMRSSIYTYVFKYYDARINDFVETESEEFAFTNTLVSTFNDIISSFDFTTENSGAAYLLPLRFDYDDAGRIYQYFDVQIWQNGESISSLRFEGETVTKDWLYGVFVPDGTDINSIVNTNNTSIKVFADVDIENNPGIEELTDPIFEKDVTFTLDQEKEILGGKIVTDAIHYNMDIVFQLVYSGQPEDFVNCELVLEAESGNIYRFSISQLSPGNNYCTIYMDSDIVSETSLAEDAFQEDFLDHPMKISITYYKRIATSGDDPEQSDGPYSTILYEQFQFTESV